jgi:integral membrane protein (TIGR01906 family)
MVFLLVIVSKSIEIMMIKKSVVSIIKGGAGLSFIALLLGLSIMITLFSYHQTQFPSIPLSEYQQSLQQATWHYLLEEPYEHLINSKTYSIEERRHLLDVKRLINDFKQGVLVTLGIFLVFVVLLLVVKKQVSKDDIIQINTISIIAALGFGLFGIVFFNHFFNQLHTLFFHNGSWIFSEMSLLIKLFPYRYFQEFFVIVLLIIGSFSLFFRWITKRQPNIRIN